MSIIKEFKSQNPGNHTIIMGGIHGNETTGIEIVKKLNKILENILNNKISFSGKITTIIANQDAAKENQRYIDEDLNRLWSDSKINQIQNKTKSLLNNEEKILLEIKTHLSQADILIDLHATRKPSDPFIFCQKSNQHFDLANFFSIQKVVTLKANSGIESMENCTDNYVDKNGGVGITVETGWKEDLSKIDIFFEDIIELLKNKNDFKSNLNLITNTQNIRKKTNLKAGQKKQIYEIEKEIQSQKKDLKYSSNIHSFKNFSKGNKIAQDSEKEYFAESDFTIIFPNSKCFYQSKKIQ